MPVVRFGLIERALSVFAPDAARRRYDSRIALELKRRLYDGAQGGRLTAGWSAGRTAADSEIALAGSALRARSRDLVRNNPLAAQAVQVLVNNLVGAGIRPRAKSTSKARNKKADALFDVWSKRADIHGHTDVYGLMALAVREMIEGGEVFAIRRPLGSDQRRAGIVPLQIELFEADHLDESRDTQALGDGRSVRQGIEYDKSGRRAAYWLHPIHPGDTQPGWRGLQDSVRMPADHVAHLFERQRVQSRGVPWGAPAMVALRDYGDWHLAEMVRKKTEACLVGIVIGDDGGEAGVAPVVEDAEGNAIEQFRPGMIAYTRGGKEIKFNQPTGAGGVEEWSRVQMYQIAAGYRVPYALMTGDLSQANFSSNRAGLNEFRRMVDLVQWHVIIPMICEPIWRWFCEAAFTAGLIDTSDVPVEWACPKVESVNPKQDAETDLLEVKAGFASRSAMVARRGWDARMIEEEIAQDNAEADRLGLIFESDPRHAAKAKAGQEPPADDEDAGGSPPPKPKKD
ncbi:phage portal protein [Paracoccus litorisediminis]|uniref:Phage portal protein n=1 Tax=Paracoccus litorisediminis TaxID=2006130 RepID=A0A844HP12_9RHOB|nr:phage portal protein [Paracoccus litorisediminis]MTH62103.1 phage portal protein [Paracoccus litorisediminis]